jgi:sporulation protein YlmC with PRC-barrel domain
MKSKSLIIAGIMLLSATSVSFSQPIAGSTQLGVSVAELRSVVNGWSTKRQILGQAVYNAKGEMVGRVDDVIVAPDKSLSYAIVGAGGFLSVPRHDVAIPVSQFKLQGEKLVLAAATKESLRATPVFEYAH